MAATQDERFASLKAMSAFTNVELNVRSLVDKWILLTYDIPVSREGNEARYKFLARARRLGAVMHTSSVYLMPWTPQAELAALDVASIGDAFLWISETKPDQMEKLTNDYDEKAKEVFKEVEGRLDKIEGHLLANHAGRARNMLDKTEPMMDSLINISVQRGDMRMYEKAAQLKDTYDILRKKL